MDMSETYIKMCDCVEIQETQYAMFIGNYFVDVDQNNFISINGISEMKVNDIWLPRQDQIQERIWTELKKSFPNATIFLVNNFFYHWLYNSGHLQIKSKTLEQTWLAFYMYEKHKLEWNGEKWQKE